MRFLFKKSCLLKDLYFKYIMALSIVAGVLVSLMSFLNTYIYLKFRFSYLCSVFSYQGWNSPEYHNKALSLVAVTSKDLRF